MKPFPMKEVMSWVVNAPVRSLLLALIFSFVFTPGLKNLYFDSSAKGLLIKGDPDIEYLKGIKDTFGDAVIHSIILKSNTIFREDILEPVLDMTFAAEGIQGVDRVVSMATVSNLKGKEGLLSTDMLLMDLPESPAKMADLKQDALSNPMFIGEVVNATGTVTGIHLFLNDCGKEKEFNSRILREVDQLVEKARGNLPLDVEIYHIGYPKVKTQITKALNSDLLLLMPLGGGAMLVVLLLFFRVGPAILIPTVTGVLSIISTMGFMGFMGFGLNPLSVIIPILLMVMGSTEDIHLLSEYMHELENGATKNRAILQMMQKSGTAILLTSLTTLLGFVTIIPNQIPMLRQFGIAASFGIAANFIITILLVPTLLRWSKTPEIRVKKEHLSLKHLRELIFVCITRYRFGVMAFFFVCGAVSLWGMQKIYVETDYVKFFQEDADVPVLFEKLNADLVGGTNFMVVVESKNADAFQDYATLSQISRLENYLNAHHGKALGYVDMVRKIHQEMNDGKKAFFTIPENNDLIAQYNLMMDADGLSRFMNHDFSKTSILVRTRARGTQEIMAAHDEIYDFIRENLTQDLSYHVTGEMIAISKASNAITRELLFCLGYMFIVIFLFISLLFFSLKAGALAMIPNIIPVVINFGVMGFVGIPLSTATFPVAMIALGIAVDDTIHFMVRYGKELKSADTNEAAIINALEKEIRPILSTSVALIAGFTMLLFAQFGSTIQLGKLAALCMFSALISDLLLTPMILIKIPIISSIAMLETYIGKKLDYSKCKLLETLKKSEVRRILAMGEIKSMESGQRFITEGESSHHMVLILEGEAAVIKEDTRIVLGTLKAGDIVGEMGFLTGEPRSASVVSSSDIELFEIDQRLIQLVGRRFPRIGNKLFFNIAQILSQRLKDSPNHCQQATALSLPAETSFPEIYE